MATSGSTDDQTPFFSKGEESVTIGDAKAAEFFSYFSTLRENKCVSDFTITCCGQQFSVHRAILMANSDHFRQMFSRESPAPCSYTVDADPCLVDSVITYMYTGQLHVAKPRLHDVEEIAIGLQIVKLVAECARIRLSELVPAKENCLEMWRVRETVEQFISVAGLATRRDKTWLNDRHVYLLPTSLAGPHKMLPDLPSSVPHADIFGAAACVLPGATGPRLLLSGVGRGRKDIWDLDLSGVDGEWRQQGSLSHRRYRQAMVYVGGNVFMVGGIEPVTRSFVSTVEVMDVASGVCRRAGKVRGSTLSHTYCHVVRQTDLLVLVGQHPKHKATDLIQVYSTTCRQVTSTCQLPVGSTVHVYGMAVTDEQVIMCGNSGTYTCPLDAVYHGYSTRIQRLSSRYTTPNAWCGVMLSEDRQSVLLIGGFSRTDEDRNTHPMYRGAVRDILGDTQTGWQQVPCSWPLKKTSEFSSGCCVVSVPSKRY